MPNRKMYAVNIPLAILLTIVLSSCSLGTSYKSIQATDDNQRGVAIQGYSPVSYFVAGRAERGNPQFSATHNNLLYYFTSEKQIALFKQNPDRYTPRYGEYCPYSLALGRKVGIDPTRFKIHNDQLLLFHSSIELATVDVEAHQDVFKKADRQFELFSLEF